MLSYFNSKGSLLKYGKRHRAAGILLAASRGAKLWGAITVRYRQTMDAIDDKTVVTEYFNTQGFDRWRRIYGDGDVNFVQKYIRLGHQRTIATATDWVQGDGNLAGTTVCDAGCGVGSLSLPLAQAGAEVSASDISAKMIGEARERARAAGLAADAIDYRVGDLESLTGSYHTVVCLDVLIHYPDSEIERMISHLADRARSRLILSFAPKTPRLSILKKIGEFFPGPSKTTRAYQHRETDIIEILMACGFGIERKALMSAPFYFARLIEAARVRS